MTLSPTCHRPVLNPKGCQGVGAPAETQVGNENTSTPKGWQSAGHVPPVLKSASLEFPPAFLRSETPTQSHLPSANPFPSIRISLQVFTKPNGGVRTPTVSGGVVLAQEDQVVTRTVMRAMCLSRAEKGPARSEFRGESAVIRHHAQWISWKQLGRGR